MNMSTIQESQCFTNVFQMGLLHSCTSQAWIHAYSFACTLERLLPRGTQQTWTQLLGFSSSTHNVEPEQAKPRNWDSSALLRQVLLHQYVPLKGKHSYATLHFESINQSDQPVSSNFCALSNSYQITCQNWRTWFWMSVAVQHVTISSVAWP